jgi:hypothetical protein
VTVKSALGGQRAPAIKIEHEISRTHIEPLQQQRRLSLRQRRVPPHPPYRARSQSADESTRTIVLIIFRP